MAQSNEKLEFKLITHFNPPLPECHLVHRWTGAQTQQFVRRTFRADAMRQSSVVWATFPKWINMTTTTPIAHFTYDVRLWISNLELDAIHVSEDDMEATAPPFLKTFVNRYSYRGLRVFIQSIRHLFGAVYTDEEKGTALDDIFCPVACLMDTWTRLKVDSFLLLNLKRGLGIYDKDDVLIVAEDDWRHSPFTNEWGLLKDQYLFHLDRSLMIGYESHLCVYHGNNRRVIQRAMAAFLLRQTIVNLIEKMKRHETLIRERDNNRRQLEDNHQQLARTSVRLGDFLDFLLKP